MAEADRERIALAAVVFAVLFAQVLLYPGVPDLVAALGATTALDASTYFLAAEFAAFIAFAGPWGAASDRLGKRRPLIVVGAVGGAVGYVALAAAPAVLDVTFRGVLVLRAVQGALTIGAFSLGMAALTDLPGGHGRNMGAAGIAIGSGTALGAPLGGQLTEVDPLAPLVVAAGVLLVAGALATRGPERVDVGGRESVREALSELAATPSLLVPFTFGFIDRLSAGFFALVGTLYFRTAFGLSAGETGLVLALFFGPFALLQYPFGVLSDKVGRVLPIAGGSLAYGLVVVAVGQVPTVELAAGLMVLVGVLGAAMSPATMALVTDLAPTERRGAAIGGFNVAGSAGFLAGVVVGGFVADAYGYPEAFLTVGGAEAAIAVIALPALLALR